MLSAFYVLSLILFQLSLCLRHLIRQVHLHSTTVQLTVFTVVSIQRSPEPTLNSRTAVRPFVMSLSSIHLLTPTRFGMVSNTGFGDCYLGFVHAVLVFTCLCFFFLIEAPTRHHVVQDFCHAPDAKNYSFSVTHWSSGHFMRDTGNLISKARWFVALHFVLLSR